MPNYEYECRSCTHSFEVSQSMSDEPIKLCPKCGKDVRRVISGGSGVIFRGSGFYVNDSRGKNSTGPAKTEASESKPAESSPAPVPEAKPQTKESA